MSALFRLTLAVALLAIALPEVTLGPVLNPGAGGSFTFAMTAKLDGRPVFVKSLRGNTRGTRYANLEADVLAASIFQRAGVKCPTARIVRLSRTSSCKALGEVVQVMQFVDERFAGGRVFPGFWPTAELADIDVYIKIALVDVIIGNADRRDANFFVTTHTVTSRTGDGRVVHTPIPIDNNAGFGSMIPWFLSSDQVNFVQSYDGLGPSGVAKQLGTIANIVRESPLSFPALGLPALEPRVFELEAELHARLDDGWWSAAVALLPAEMIPDDLHVDPAHEMPDGSMPAGVTREAFFGSLVAGMSHAQLVAARRQELRETFAWRREHLRAALVRYLAWRRADPELRKRDAEVR